MVTNALIDQWTRDAAAPFQGWDFSYLDGRLVESKPTWDYLALARAAAQSHDILDIDTGGGESFSRLAPFPGRATAVEGYVPNLAVARGWLEALGIPVIQADSASSLPFEDALFDLVLNRHGSIAPAEIHRVLKRGGVLLTQQVGGDNLADLAACFGATSPWPGNTLDGVVGRLEALGFKMRRAEAWRGPVTFADVGALVYFLKAIPWVVDGFEVERHLQVLEALQARLESGHPLRFTATRFLIDALKA
jgi:SAM-dependent methyltransferase